MSGQRSGVRGQEKWNGTTVQSPPPTSSELLAIAVARDARGKGIGRSLIATFESWLLENTHDSRPTTLDYTVATSATDPVSNAFYQACGFTLAGEFTHHGNRMNEYQKAVTRGQ
jgi:GNAT superfamily N-acetyltransferase